MFKLIVLLFNLLLITPVSAAVLDCIGWESKPLIGLSSDIKPDSNNICQRFIEIDTTRIYYWDGSSWRTFSGGITKSERISTLTSTLVKITSGEVLGFYVSSTNAGTLVFYDDNTGACNTGQLTGTITPVVGWNTLPLTTTSGICVLSAGTAVDATIIYR